MNYKCNCETRNCLQSLQASQLVLRYNIISIALYVWIIQYGSQPTIFHQCSKLLYISSPGFHNFRECLVWIYITPRKTQHGIYTLPGLNFDPESVLINKGLLIAFEALADLNLYDTTESQFYYCTGLLHIDCHILVPSRNLRRFYAKRHLQ